MTNKRDVEKNKDNARNNQAFFSPFPFFPFFG
jgi:hypothetical protein